MRRDEDVAFQRIVGKRIRRCLSIRRESQRQLADTLGITGSKLSRMLDGSISLPLGLLSRIAEHFGVSVEYLMGGELSEADEAKGESHVKDYALKHWNPELLDSFSSDDTDRLAECFERARKGELSLASIAAACKVKPSTLVPWYDAYYEGGKEALMQKKIKKNSGRPRKNA